MSNYERISTGIPAMDTALDNIRIGDNIVWQVTDLADFSVFAHLLAQKQVEDGRKVIYVHFSANTKIFSESDPVEIVSINLDHRFENFTVNIHQLITDSGEQTVFIFDCLSDLQIAWATDLIMGDFFKLTSPHISKSNCVAWYPLIRGRHSFDAVARVRDTTQIFLDVYSDSQKIFLRPMKVSNRYSDTMFLPHIYDRRSGRFQTATEGVDISHFYQLMHDYSSQSHDQNEDSWDRFFRKAKTKYEQGEDITDECRQMCNIMVTRDDRLRELIYDNFLPTDYFEIRDHMIGTGMVGGKACGMLLARKLIENHAPDTFAHMEPHDSFYIGSDVFYSYIVNNGFWDMRVRQRQPEEYFSLAPQMSELLLKGKFSSTMREEFTRLLDYYGQDPFIVRSSSILEDGFGNAFAGKYDSVFCSNSGSLSERLEEFENAIRQVYASTMSLAALDYRKRRGLEHRDEQMSLLVMRVSGSRYGQYFMPAAAGVGYSLSPYRFGTDQHETSGMLRLVMGLGTAAVDRMQGSYPRLVSMDHPTLNLATSDAERHQFSQRKIDVVDTLKGGFESLDLRVLESQLPYFLKRNLLSHDFEAEDYFRNMGDSRDIYYISCDGIVKNEALMNDMKHLLRTLQDHYEYPVDIEFTINIAKSGEYVINMLQCRPLQIAKDYEVITIPENIPEESHYLECKGACMGMSRMLKMDYIVDIDTLGYYKMPYNDKYKVARALGAINWALREQNRTLMLFTPGRICTSSPELGVPSTFAEISEFNVICEMSETGAGYMPELSYGSHIFQDLVEAGILYVALSDSNPTQTFRPQMLHALPNQLTSLAPAFEELADIVKVYDLSDYNFTLYYDMPNEYLLCACDLH